MNNYLALIRKADFADLFKFGYLHVNKDLIRQFTCSVAELSNRKPIFDDLVYFSNSFDSTFTYLIIHYVSNAGRPNDINIADVQNVFALDREAKIELSSSLDPRIQIQDPIWPSATLSLQKKHFLNDCRTGAENLWKIYSFKDSISSMKSYIPDSVITEFVDEIFENRHPNGDLPIWVYIMRYERHDFYPNNTIGNVMDTIHAVFNFMQKREVDGIEIEGTNIIQFLYHLNNTRPDLQKSFVGIIEALKSEPSAANMLTAIKNIEPNIDLLKVASLFFIFKEMNKEDFKFKKESFDYGAKFGVEFSVASYLLGHLLGHAHTYGCLYDELPLPIFKKKQIRRVEADITEIVTSTSFSSLADNNNDRTDAEKDESQLVESIINKQEDEPVKVEIDENNADVVNNNKDEENEKATKTIAHFQTSLFEDEHIGTPLPEPLVMKKSPRARKDIVTAYTQEEFDKYTLLGYNYYPESKKKNKKK